jgi:diguanylate cyclase (GGDEF)-like protein
MDIAINPTIREPKLVNPDAIRGTISPAAPQTVSPGVPELSGSLQTTLEVEEQINLFTREIRRAISIDGVVYRNSTEALELVVGDAATHRATYDLELHGTQLGSVEFNRELPFAKQEIITLEDLLCALVYPLRNALTYRQAIKLALRDPLTGVPNRTAFDQAIQRELELAKRQQLPVSLLVIDIDHFKLCNDTYGHRFGDDVLKAVASTVVSTIRRCDLLFRYGGEEFVVLASHTSQQGAQQLAERIRRNVESLATVAGRETQVTVSVGLAALRDHEDASGLFNRADQALYRAKAEGRNRVVLD